MKLVVETGALNLLVEAGYHPQLGARALKRTLERQVTAPLAARLSATSAEQPLVVFINNDEGRIKVDACTLSVVESDARGKSPFADAAEFLDRIEDVLIRVEDLADRLFPAGEILLGDGQSSLVQMQRLNLRQQMRRVSRMLDRADERRAKQDQPVPRSTSTRPRRAADKGYKRQLAKVVAGLSFDNQLFAHNLHQLLTELQARSEIFGDNINDYLVDLLNETSLLNALSTITDESDGQTLIRVASLDATGRTACVQLRDLYRTLFEKEFNCKVIKAETDAGTHAHMHVATLLLEGPLAALLAPLEAGTHLFVSDSQTYQPVVVTIGSAQQKQFESLPPVLRIYAEPEATLDLRTQLLSIGKMGSAELRAFVLAALPAPHEFD